MPATEEAANRLAPFIERLTSSPRVGEQIEIILPGGNRHTFNGVSRPLSPGVREVEFVPRVGTRNLTPEVPALPLIEPMEATPVPAKRALVLGRVSLQGTVLVGIVEDTLRREADRIAALQVEEELRAIYLAQANEDIAIAELVMPCPEPALAAVRAKVATATQTRTRTATKTTRIHGYSRRKA